MLLGLFAWGSELLASGMHLSQSRRIAGVRDSSFVLGLWF